MLDVKARWGNRGTERRGPGETEGRSPREKEAPELHQATDSEPSVPALPSISLPDSEPSTMPADPDPSITPAPVIRRRKRKSDVSHSVAGADLRKRRKRIVEQNVSHSHSSDIAKHFAGGELCKTEYFAYYGHPQFLSLEQGQFAVERKLAEIDFILSTTQPDTPKDGDCMFHALMDQLEYNAELKGDVADVKELRWKIVHFGYTFYLRPPQ